jgi:hypothetical protein
MVHPQVADGRDNLQIWRVAANVLNKQLGTANKEWSSSVRVVWGPDSPSPQNVTEDLCLGWFLCLDQWQALLNTVINLWVP